MSEHARISVCGVVEYPCQGACGDWIREHEAIWASAEGEVGLAGGGAYCPTCLPLERRKARAAAA